MIRLDKLRPKKNGYQVVKIGTMNKVCARRKDDEVSLTGINS